jgi:photosystem II stability/assembly factor-like uncharacterized protein
VGLVVFLLATSYLPFNTFKMKKFAFGLLLTVLMASAFSIYQYSDLPAKKQTQEKKKMPNNWFFQQRAYPYDHINQEAYKEALVQANVERDSYRMRNAQQSWKFAGCINIGGRITDIEMHAADQQTIYAGAATGGIFKSTNAGTSWLPIFDKALSLSIGDIAIAPSNSKIVYVGTGEANGGGGSSTYDGLGVYKSTDAGSTWAYTGLDEIGNTGRIVINPQDPQNVFVAAMGNLYGKTPDRGIYRTKDGGSTWQKVLFVSDSTGAIDIVINPKNPDTLYAALWERIRTLNRETYGGTSCNVYRSFDGGDTWTLLGNGLPAASTNSGRIGLAISESSPNVVYAIYADKVGYFNGIYKTTNNGNSWARVSDGALSNMFASYGWWFGRVHVDPTDPNVVYAIGFDLYKSTNGGSSWTNIGSSVHVDHHSVYVHPKNPNFVLLGNDGGVYISKNAASSWTHVPNLPITQFYTCEVDTKNPKRLYGGAQDNGVNRTMTGNLNDWSNIVGGDGFVALVDPTNSNYVYGESQYGALRRSTNGGTNFSSATTGINSSDRKNWNTPVVFDPTNPEIMYYGANRLYKSTNRAVSWTAISSDLTNGNAGNGLGTITCIAVAPSNTNVIYVGTDDGNVWRTTNGGANWSEISASLPVRWITRIAVDMQNPSIAYVTLSGFRLDEYLPHILKTTDAGSTWSDISGNLPAAPINEVILDPTDNSTLYIGTDVGVYAGSSSGVWFPLGDSLPNVPVVDLTLHQPTRTLVAATFGRSMYKYDLSTTISVIEYGNPLSSLTVQPNPVYSSAKISFHLAEQQQGKIELFDLSGKLVNVLYEGILNKGDNEFTWNVTENKTNALPSGTYICRIVSGKTMASKKIQLVR